MGFFSVLLIAFTLYACGGAEEATDLSDVVNNPSDSVRNLDGGVLSNVISDGAIPFDPTDCGKESANDFNNFMKIPYGASEMMLDTILGKSTAGEYVDDSSSFVYYYKDAERVPITVWANGRTSQIEMIFVEVVSYVQYFKSDFEGAIDKYNMLDCDARWFGMQLEDVKKIMGEPRKTEESEDNEGKEVLNLFYDSEDYSIAVNFKFYESQDYMCSSVMVNWFY